MEVLKKYMQAIEIIKQLILLMAFVTILSYLIGDESFKCFSITVFVLFVGIVMLAFPQGPKKTCIFYIYFYDR